MAFVESGGRRIYTERRGEGPPLLFLHGAGSNAATWWRQTPAFADRYACITMDQRCFGRSVAPIEEFRVDLLVQDALAVLDHWGARRAVAVGQSLGGVVGLRMALWRPDRVAGFVACDSPLGIVNAELQRVLDIRASKREFLTIEQRSFGTRFLERSPELARLYAEINAFNPSHNLYTPAQWNRAMQDLLAPDQLLDMRELRSIRCPTLWLVGSEDPLVPVSVMEECAALAPGGELVVVDGTGHSTYFEKPEAFNDHVLSFLRRRVKDW